MTAMHWARNPDVMRDLPRAALRLMLFLLATVLASPVHAQTGDLEDLDSFPREALTIHAGPGKKQTLEFEVWLADTPNRQAQGLMFVRSLPKWRGMLFVHDSPRPIGMWMKNTYIPLDMVFIAADGRIQQIVENTTPHSLDVIRSNQPALAVLEIAGGEARRLKIKPGHTVSHPAFARR
jgi:uncharacterized protein